MQISFHKYQGTGNDFIMIDDRDTEWDCILTTENILFLCHRRYGIGADGLILLKNSKNHDFKMVYFNADGNESSMCGNGGRCIVHFAHYLKIFEKKTTFEAIDGPHDAFISEEGIVHLKMLDVDDIYVHHEGQYELNTGSPHLVTFRPELPADVSEEGAAIRYSPPYADNGINVNFVRESASCLEVATYERGVEDETLSCGTGVTAVSLAHAKKCEEYGPVRKTVKTKGGELNIAFHMSPQGKASDIWLIGPAQLVFEGNIKF
jgi:diaminopimelate epimerase